jgi:transcriptional regulator with XRE-family HTH domain
MDETRGVLGDYLRSRRARLLPGDVGLIGGGPRRVPGLRREEVASLAGVNVDYYARLEQGRLRNVSTSVIDAVARALRLDGAERAHLRHLASPTTGRARPPQPQQVRPAVRSMLAALESQPAFVLGDRMDVLAANWMAQQVMGSWLERASNRHNLARFIFLDPEARLVHRDWDTIAEEAVATLRHYSGQRPDDERLQPLVDDLKAGSPEFARWWTAHDVRSRSHGRKTYRHPQMGEITVHCEALEFPGDDHQRLCIYTAEPGSDSHQALMLMASLHSPAEPVARDGR